MSSEQHRWFLEAAVHLAVPRSTQAEDSAGHTGSRIRPGLARCISAWCLHACQYFRLGLPSVIVADCCGSWLVCRQALAIFSQLPSCINAVQF